MEFQERKAPHFHMLTTDLTERDMVEIRDRWLHITYKEGDNYEQRKRYGIHFRFIENSGIIGYIKKDFHKQTQKAIPDNYSRVGRLWGHARAVKVVEKKKEITLEEYNSLKIQYEQQLRLWGIKKKEDHKYMRGFTFWSYSEETREEV